MAEIRAGDMVVATKNGGHDSSGMPYERPIAGRAYRVLGVYQMRYGLGCRLEGMDPWPYKGYFLYVHPRYVRSRMRAEPGWYFTRLEKADADFTRQLREVLAGHGTVQVSNERMRDLAGRDPRGITEALD